MSLEVPHLWAPREDSNIGLLLARFGYRLPAGYLEPTGLCSCGQCSVDRLWDRGSDDDREALSVMWIAGDWGTPSSDAEMAKFGGG